MAKSPVYVLSFFLKNGLPATGLSPTIRIREIGSTNLVVTDDAMVEIGDGFYSYDFSLLFDPNIQYAVRVDGTTSLRSNERWKFGGNDSFVGDIRNEFRNKKELIKINDTQYQEKVYSDDGLTVIRTTDIEKVDANTERRTPA